MSVILMPFDKELAKTISDNVQKKSLENILITRNYSNVLETAKQVEALNYDYGIGIRASENGLRRGLHIICSGKNPIPEKAEKLIFNLKKGKELIISDSPFVYKNNSYGAPFEQKEFSKTHRSSWYAEIKAGENIDKPVFIIVIGEDNLDKTEELEKEILSIIEEPREEIQKKELPKILLKTRQVELEEEPTTILPEAVENDSSNIEDNEQAEKTKRSPFSLNLR